jgi:hypothetical protein
MESRSIFLDYVAIWSTSLGFREQILISLIIGSSEGGFRSGDERKRAEKMRYE